MRRLICLAMMLLLLCVPALGEETAYDDLTAACRDLRAAVYAREESFSFYLTKAAVDGRSSGEIRDILTDVLEGYVEYGIVLQAKKGGLTVRVTGEMRPSLNILAAWETGDRSRLTEDEARCMEIALAMVAQAQEGADSLLDVERALYDAICARLVYEAGPGIAAYGTEAYNRVTSCIGGLVDGRTQCLGYAETFYLLCRLAGIDAQMQYGFPGDGYNVKHAWNLVRLGGRHYMVDVCWGDTNGDSFEPHVPSYAYFNAGQDALPAGRRCHPEAELAPIAAETEISLTAFDAVCASLTEAVDCAVRQYHYHQPYAHVFIPGQTLTLEQIDSAMWARISQAKITAKWGRTAADFAGGTYIIFRWVLD